MKNIIRNWFQRKSKKLSANESTQQLHLEHLEGRWVPATIGVTKYAALDFDGEYISSSHMSEGGWSGYSAKSFASFQSLFNSSRPWLDMNYDGNVNSTDANLAIDYVMDKVHEDFAPYKVSIFEMDQDNAQGYLTDGIIGDVTVIITGSTSSAHTSGSSWWGVAPWADAGNTEDEIVFVFAGGSVDSSAFNNRYEWLNQVARTVSHEMGHAYGLDHEVSEYGSLTDALSHSIMGTPNRDWHRDFVFEDKYFINGDGDYQNAHRHLLQDNILGRSNNTYISVIKPGVLTVSGNYAANNIEVSQYNSSYWKVIMDGQTTYVNLNSYSVHSLNPFDVPISKLEVIGEGGNDRMYVSYNFSASVTAFGGDGNDSIYGGAAMDFLYGENGNDYIYARSGNDYLFGGNGNDYLYGYAGNDYISGGAGNDYLSGSSGNDWLYGGTGYDRLYGSSGNDYLSGGIDGVADYLNGGSGADDFDAEWYWVYYYLSNRDNPVDFNSGEGDQIV